jgi:hypothetical protein
MQYSGESAVGVPTLHNIRPKFDRQKPEAFYLQPIHVVQVHVHVVPTVTIEVVLQISSLQLQLQPDT